MSNMFTQPFGITWRKAMLSAPRLVPDAVLYYTSPTGPHPIIVNLPSTHGKFDIPLYIFIPPSEKIPKPKRIKKSRLRRPQFSRTASRASVLSTASTATTATTDSQTEKIPAKLPVLIDFHGGGFIFGSCQEQAPFCAQMSRELGAIVISVDYRLGPAAKFPAATHDAEDVLAAVTRPGTRGWEVLKDEINRSLKKGGREEIDIDERRVGVSGFSSGGNLALGLVLDVKANDYRVKQEKCPVLDKDWDGGFAKDWGRRIPVMLFYPSLDCRLLPAERPLPKAMQRADGIKKKSFVESLRLETDLMPTYLPREVAGHPRASPGLAPLEGIHKEAHMYLVLPELDTLNEQSEVWVEKCRKFGIGEDVLEVRRVKGVVHGWTQFPETWVQEEHRKLRDECFQRAREICEKAWEVKDELVEMEPVRPVSSSLRPDVV